MKLLISNIIIIFILSTFPSLLFAAPLPNFPDPNLQDCVFEQAVMNNWSEAEEITFLNCENRGIENLYGLELLPSLQGLELSNNRIENASPLGLLNGLDELDLSENRLKTINDLFSLMNLQKLNVSGNTQIPVSEVAGIIWNNPQLESLGLNGIAINDFNMLPLMHSMTAEFYDLRELDIGNTGIADLGKLMDFPNLRVLNVSGNGVTDLMPLSNLTQLRSLDVSKNNIVDLFALNNLTALERLWLSGNGRIDPNALPPIIYQNRGLKALGLGDIKIGDLSLLPLMNSQTGRPYALEALDVSNSGIDNINILGQFMQLRSLNISHNDVEDVYVLSHLGLLEELDLSHNQIEVVDMLNNLTALTDLNLSGNSKLDFNLAVTVLLNNQNLQHLGLGSIEIQDDNHLALFKANGQPYDLKSLDVSDTGVNNLDFLNIYASLEKLNISGLGVADLNNISMLFSENKLVELDLSNNNLRNLFNLQILKNLRKLNVSGNSQIPLPEVAAVLWNNPQLQSLGVNSIAINDFNMLPLTNSMTGEFYDLRELDIGNTGVADLARLIDFPNLRVLNVSGNGVTDLMPLSNLTQLRSLDAAENKIVDLFALNNLTALERLWLSGNSRLNPNALQPVISQNPGLKALGLGGIDIVDLSSLPLMNSQNGQPYALEVLDVSSSGIVDINMLGQLKQLRSLNVSHNDIDDVQVLSQMMLMEELDLSHNQINIIDMLGNLTRLTNLNISGNSKLDFNLALMILVNNKNLQHLGLGSIAIQDSNQLVLYKFNGQPYGLKSLDVSNTGIDNLDFLNHYSSLEKLDIGGLGVTDINNISAIFNENIMQELNLSGNNLQNLFGLQQLTNLRKLNISGNPLLPFPEVVMTIGNNPQLRTLGVNGIEIGDFNMLPLMNPMTGEFYDLHELDIGNTGIADLTRLMDFPNMQVLNISGNEVDDLMPLSNLTELRSLDASENNIADLFMLNNLTALERLWLSGNSHLDLNALVSVIYQNQSLKELGLGGINIGDLSLLPLMNTQTGEPYALETLDVSNSGIGDINMLGQFMQLRSLNISHNDIEDVQVLSQMQFLEELDLSYNRIETTYMLNNLTRLTDLNLSGNSNLDFNLVIMVLQNNQSLQHLGLGSIAIQDGNQLALFRFNGQPYDLKSLDISNTGISDLNFLNFYFSLEKLNISGLGLGNLNNVSTIFSENKLLELNISHNNLQNLFELHQLTNLRMLNVSSNTQIPLPEVVAILWNNPQLRSLGVNGIAINDFNMLPLANAMTGELYDLRELDIGNTGISDLARLIDFPDLQVLNVSGNGVNSLLPLNYLTRLRSLDAAENNIADLIPLNNLTTLERLWLSGNSSLDLNTLVPVIYQNQGLKALGLGGINIGDFSLLPLMNSQTGMPYALVDLDISNTGISILDFLSDYPTLDVLNVAYNDITNVAPLLNLQDPSLIDLSGNNNIQCPDLDMLGINFLPEVLVLPATCLMGAIPEMDIVFPFSGDEFTTEDFVTLEAWAFDQEDGDIRSSINWTSNLSGQLGVGHLIQLQLESGTHLITATVVDSAGNEVSTSTTITVTSVQVQDYCASWGSNTNYEWIDEVSVGGLVNTSGNDNGYGDYSYLNNMVLSYGSNTFSLVPGFQYGSYPERWNIWVDLNQNGVFEGTELLHSSSSNGPIYGDIQIPPEALSGTTRMRVSMKYGSAPAACGNFYWGEVEDYSVTIQ